jgi:hypothetical protein
MRSGFAVPTPVQAVAFLNFAGVFEVAEPEVMMLVSSWDSCC